MRKLCTAVNVLVTVLVPVGFLVNLCYDLAHPELWCDWQHDPRLYGTLAIVVIPADSVDWRKNAPERAAAAKAQCPPEPDAGCRQGPIKGRRMRRCRESLLALSSRQSGRQ